jgi:hypothetical protein
MSRCSEGQMSGSGQTRPNPVFCAMPTYPDHTPFPPPGQLPAEAGPQVVIPSAGDRAAVGVAQQLPIRRGVPLTAVLDEPAHQSGRDRLPADRLALLRSKIRH